MNTRQLTLIGTVLILSASLLVHKMGGGVESMWVHKIFINIGMNMGISPVTGIPLPLVSAGGSSMWAIMIALGMSQSVRMRNT